MQQFGGMSTGTTLGKGLEETYKNSSYLKDIDLIREFIEENTGFKVETISSNSKKASIQLRAKNA